MGQVKAALLPDAVQPAAARGRTLPQPTITRIDFFLYNEKAYSGTDRPACRVLKYAAGWTAHTPPAQVQINPPLHTPAGEQPFNLDTALAQLAARGWTVRRWRTGARAWRGAPQPIRDHAGISAMRRRANAGLLARDPYAPPVSADFAFDY